MIKLKNLPKSWALLFFAVDYLLAFLVGWLVMKLSGVQTIWIQILIFDVVATVFVWGTGLVIQNASIYDPYWSVFPPVAIGLAMMLSNTQLVWQNGLFLFGVCLWSLRLTYNFVIHYEGFEYLDWRYQMLHDQNPKIWFLTNLFGINLMPTTIVFIQLIAISSRLANSAQFGGLVLGFLIMSASATIQLVSDTQMSRFREANQARKAVMKDGLWSISRHPNYFGEVSFWWGVWVSTVAFGAPWFPTIIAPILMTMLFLFISIPMMEKKILSTRPEYEEVRQSVSMFLPFFPKKK